jgi:hypothetical protein
VAVRRFGQQRTRFLQRADDGAVGVLEHVEPGKGARLGGQGAGFIDRAQHRQVVLAPGVEVVDAMPRRGVHQACAAFGGDVVAAEHHRAGALQQRVAIADPLQGGTFHAEDRRECQAEAALQVLAQLGGHHQVAGGRQWSFAARCHRT